MNLINLAHGSFVLLGVYLTATINEILGIDPFLALAAAATLFPFGFVFQQQVINRVI